ncbi:uncharacterized protein BT62DRAFT_734683 [Guyanagaster necrorhizus]|uniref:Uncharacterized protein n=1 Tax=Guyanagaster necrorhizus TaxID=856835 RepID=A0A9P7VEZ3_9AGAR|nr:uncharacterized protein BT62DRAFT_734683 [Guyanagaster necrorhizus MCA 3950]KAG7439479.1 hypothetical protein BT62DRAFT_734683 [Guyanagaster necrorhizus MCA 3950]
MPFATKPPWATRQLLPRNTDSVYILPSFPRLIFILLHALLMTEYDYSPEAAERYQATMRRISRWVDDAEAHACEFKSPFEPRSDIGDDEVRTRDIHVRSPAPPPVVVRQRVPPPLYAPVPGPMPPHSHGPAPPPPRLQQVPLHGPAPPPSHSRRTHSPSRHSSTHHSRHRSNPTYYVSPSPTPPPVPYYPPGYPNNGPYYTSPYNNPPPQYIYAQPPGQYVLVPPKGRSTKVVVSYLP